MTSANETISTLLSQRDGAAFEQVFKANFKQLHAYAFTILRDEAEAEEIVQQVFFKIWERNDSLQVNGPVTAYLCRAVHNECLNLIKHRKVRNSHQLYVAHSMKNEVEHAAKKMLSRELEERYTEALNELPEQCRTIFQLSRFNELKYREIADRLGLSVKTVENQMGKALKLLRAKLVDFLTFIFIFLHV